MSKYTLLSFLMVAATLGASAASPAQAGSVTARDIRMETRTTWDYQPLQGPRPRAKERDFFRPTTALPEQPLTPPPPVESGDFRDNPPRAEDFVPPKAHPKEPATTTALEIGIQGSSYHYHESSLGVKLQGPQGGVQMIATGLIGDQWFVRADGRASIGSLDYKGSGEMKTKPNSVGEMRVEIGRDFLTRHYGISPYVGLGYRYLRNDIRGVTTSGALGYRRDSQYFFAPVGLEPRIQFPNGDRLSMMAEFDPLIQGWQESYLDDISASYPRLKNKQKWGYGARADLMYQTGEWAFGPFANYWNINQSTNECGTGSGAAPLYVCGYEPHNHTLEYGFQLRYKFYED